MRHPLSNARQRCLLWGSISGVALVTGLAVQTSCARLKPIITENQNITGDAGGASLGSPETLELGETILDGGPPDAIAKMACGDSLEQLSHTRGILPDGGLLDISQATGYTPDPSIPSQAQALLPSNNAGAAANQMRGTQPASGGTLQYDDIYRTLDDPNTMIKGVLFRDGPRGVNIDAPVYLGPTTHTGQESLGKGYSTAFPVTVARAATWDLDLEAQIGADLADEVLATNNDLTISPCVNILRNPAWGRAQETYGEDSFAIGRMGTAYVDGVQNYIPACVKHLAAYNIENGRFAQVSQMDSQTLHEIYGRHFEMIVQDAAVACVMASYNSIELSDGPDTTRYKDTENPVLLKEMLRGTFGFKGFVMSDFWAMTNYQSTGLMPSQYQTVAANAVNSGLDMEMPWDLNFANIQANTSVSATALEASAQRILEQKLRFNMAKPTGPIGLKVPTSTLNANGVTNTQNHLDDAELQAEEAMVLLKNEPPIGSIGAIQDGGIQDGSTVDGGVDDGSTGNGGAQDGGTQNGGPRNVLPIDPTTVHTVAVIGASVPYTLTNGASGAVNFAADLRIGDLGSSRINPDPSIGIGPLAGITAAAGEHNVQVITAVDDETNPSSLPGALSAAASADFVVVMAGLTPQDEGEEYTGAGDRIGPDGGVSYHLDCKSGSGAQDALISQVAALHKPMVVVIEAGSAVDMPWLDSVPAVVMAWYPGELGGTALGRLLFGDVNFSGKLPITWPKSEADEPVFNTGGGTVNGLTGGVTTMSYYLGYRWFDCSGSNSPDCPAQKITPLFAYGSGLSYTTFSYDFLGVPCSTVSQHGVVDVQVAITNTGNVPGNEVAFLFVSYPQTTARRSAKELKGFHRTKQPVQPGQTVLFTIPLRVQDLKYWNTSANQWTVESGPVQIMVGPSADNLPLTDTLMVTGAQ